VRLLPISRLVGVGLRRRKNLFRNSPEIRKDFKLCICEPGPAVKRRIEIIRERWVRMRVRSTVTTCCSRCESAYHWATLARVASALQLNADGLDRAIDAGLLPILEESSGRLVCLRCVHDLLANKEL